jgi:hypothetical protein
MQCCSLPGWVSRAGGNGLDGATKAGQVVAGHARQRPHNLEVGRVKERVGSIWIKETVPSWHTTLVACESPQVLQISYALVGTLPRSCCEHMIMGFVPPTMLVDSSNRMPECPPQPHTFA